MDADVIIVGGGAAGLAAGAFLCRAAWERGKTLRLLILEKAPRVGKKLLATGNGTCNLTNTGADASRYHGTPALAEAVLSVFSPTEAMAFFTAIGVDCILKEDGRVYPYSAQAGAVLDALRLEVSAGGGEVRCDSAVTDIRQKNGQWCVSTATERFSAPAVLVTVGGAAAPALGGSADGYRLLTALGHEKTPLFPSIVQLRTDTAFVRAVKGLRADAAVSLWRDGKPAATAAGEVLFTDYGLSGPAVMAVSRVAGDWERRKVGTLTARLDLLPGWDTETLTARLCERAKLPGRTLEDLFTGLLHKRVGQTVLRAAGILPLDRSAATLTPAEAKLAAVTAKNWEFAVTGTQGFGGAQVTAGGIAADGFSPETLESKLCPGLYAAGEVLDVDGDCGGFNLQFAWSSAFVAARAIAAALWG